MYLERHGVTFGLKTVALLTPTLTPFPFVSLHVSSGQHHCFYRVLGVDEGISSFLELAP